MSGQRNARKVDISFVGQRLAEGEQNRFLSAPWLGSGCLVWAVKKTRVSPTGRPESAKRDRESVSYLTSTLDRIHVQPGIVLCLS